MDIANATISFIVFKGYQFYAMAFTDLTDRDSSNLLLLGNYDPGNPERKFVFFGLALLWFSTESCLIYIQIFAVSTLTHLDNLIKESNRSNNKENQFYAKHKKWARRWAIVFFLIGAGLLFLTFFWPTLVPNDPTFVSYKIFYKYYSTATVTFWLCLSLVLILVLTDRLLSYEGFKKREDFRNSNKQNAGRNTIMEPVRHYTVQKESTAYENIVQSLKEKFKDKSDGEIEKLADDITNRYNDKMAEHFTTLQDKIKEYIDEPETLETSMSYVKYLRYFNVFILIGYVLVLISYEELNTNEGK